MHWGLFLHRLSARTVHISIDIHLYGGNCHWGIELEMYLKTLVFVSSFRLERRYRYGNAAIDTEQVVHLPGDSHHTKTSVPPEYRNKLPANFTINSHRPLLSLFIWKSICLRHLFFIRAVLLFSSIRLLCLFQYLWLLFLIQWFFLSSLTTKNPLQRPKVTTLFYFCDISTALYRV